MAQITVYAQGTQNWDTAGGWKTAGGTPYDDPQNGVDTFICNLNSQGVTMNKDVTVDQIVASDGAGYLSVSGTRTLTVGASNGLLYSGTSTSGMVRYTTGASLTVNGQSSLSGNGYLFVGGGTGVLALNNGSNIAVAVSGTSTGRCVYHHGTGNLTIAGQSDNSASGGSFAVYVDAAAAVSLSNVGGTVLSIGNSTAAAHYGLYAPSGSPTITIAGNISGSGYGSPAYLMSGTALITGNISCGYVLYYPFGAIRINGATVTLDGEILDSISLAAISLISGTLNWRGNRSLASGKNALIHMMGGTLNLNHATEAPLVLTNDGTFGIIKTGGTLNYADIGGGAAHINLTSAAARAIILGDDTAEAAMLSTPTLPDVANVWYGSGQYGYSGGLLTPTKRASSITNCSAGNVKIGVAIDDVTGTLRYFKVCSGGTFN